MPSLNWHDLESFEQELYRQVESDKTVQFVGVASMPEVDGGDVGVFRFVEGGRCLIATKGRYEQGQTFTPIAEYQEPDEERMMPNCAPSSKRTSHELRAPCRGP